MAYGKLQGLLNSAPVLLPGRHAINGALMAANVGAMGMFLVDPTFNVGISMLTATSLMSATMGVSFYLLETDGLWW